MAHPFTTSTPIKANGVNLHVGDAPVRDTPTSPTFWDLASCSFFLLLYSAYFFPCMTGLGFLAGFTLGSAGFTFSSSFGSAFGSGSSLGSVSSFVSIYTLHIFFCQKQLAVLTCQLVMQLEAASCVDLSASEAASCTTKRQQIFPVYNKHQQQRVGWQLVKQLAVQQNVNKFSSKQQINNNRGLVAS